MTRSETVIDLRSDTVTRPTEAMRRAMLEAPLGDDVYGEDPSARALEEAVAARLGKEAAVFVPSGTMANQIAVALFTRPGDAVLAGAGAHTVLFESGASAALSGVQLMVAGRRIDEGGGFFDGDELLSALPPELALCSKPSLVCLENTHNLSGGRVLPQDLLRSVARTAKERDLALHLDGARLWNASVASGQPVHKLAEAFDTVSVCFSKGLGAPVGSALAGSVDLMKEARRFRRLFGGAMRQVGVLASAALFGLEHHVDRLEEDHENAQTLCEGLHRFHPGVHVPESVDTNIVIAVLERPLAAQVASRASELGVRCGHMGPTSLRLVTHLDVTREDVPRALSVIRTALTEVLG
jgi:threonine aldolase